MFLIHLSYFFIFNLISNYIMLYMFVWLEAHSVPFRGMPPGRFELGFHKIHT